MPKEKPFYIDIEKLLKYDKLDTFMFGYVMGMQRALPSNPLNKCIEMYKEDFMLHEDNYSLDHALQTYYRILESYREYRKLDK